MTCPALEVKNLNKYFGAIHVTRDVSLSLPAGARHAVIGPNGAGKTTLVHQMTGLLRPCSGSIFMSGEDISHCSPEQRAKQGMGRTFQISSLFTRLTVAENIAMAIAARLGIDGSFGAPVFKRAEIMDEVAELLGSLGMTGLAAKTVNELAYGQRRLVDIAIALAMRPTVLLLDEPAAGVPTSEGEQLFELFQRLPEHIAVLIIEHDMNLVFNFARTITVLVDGAVLVDGPTQDVRADQGVKDVYLGGRHG